MLPNPNPFAVALQKISRSRTIAKKKQEFIEPVVEYQILQRSQLADFICTRVKDITLQGAVNWRIQTADLMKELCGCREVALRYRLRIAPSLVTFFKEKSPKLPSLAFIFPLVCGKT
jgi:hypothetical protein